MSTQAYKAKNKKDEDHDQAFIVKNSIEDPTGVNIVVLEGLRKDELELFSEVVSVFPDLPRFPTKYSWDIDRFDQLDLPLSTDNTFAVCFKMYGS